jgi:hypothetical protein
MQVDALQHMELSVMFVYLMKVDQRQASFTKK